jgi:hypothetical protein
MQVMRNLLAASAAALVLAACGTTPVAMNYQAAGSTSKFATGTGEVAVEAFVDDRGEPPRWLGAIRGGFGNPLKVLETDETVAKMVQVAFAEGVRVRAQPSSRNAGQYEVRGVIKKLDCSQYVRREAHAVIEVTVVDRATKAERFRRTYHADTVDGSLANLATGVFASVDDLRVVAQQTLRDVVDKALDDPAFRGAISG